jgi:hypothetical protein
MSAQVHPAPEDAGVTPVEVVTPRSPRMSVTSVGPSEPVTPGTNVPPLDIGVGVSFQDDGAAKAAARKRSSVLNDERKKASIARMSLKQANDNFIHEIGEAAGSGGGSNMLDLDEELMNRDVGFLSERLKNMDKGLLKPGGTLMTYWDFFTLGALFFTATVTPCARTPLAHAHRAPAAHCHRLL